MGLHICRPVKPEEAERLQELLADLHESSKVGLVFSHAA